MELIVQKAVELGVYGIVPFAAKRSVVRLDEKKAGKKQIRWQAIAKGAAEQSGRGLIPEVEIVKTYAEALEFAKELDVILVPYELEEGMKATMSIIEAIRPGQSVGIFIGPEGGFEEQEIGQACACMKITSICGILTIKNGHSRFHINAQFCSSLRTFYSIFAGVWLTWVQPLGAQNNDDMSKTSKKL